MDQKEKRILKNHATLDNVIAMMKNAREKVICWDKPALNKSFSKGAAFNVFVRNIAEIKKSGNVDSIEAMTVFDNAIEEFADYMPLTPEIYNEIVQLRLKQYKEEERMHANPISMGDFEKLLNI